LLNELNRIHGEKNVSDMEQAMKPLEIGKAVDFGIKRTCEWKTAFYSSMFRRVLCG